MITQRTPLQLLPIALNMG